MEHDVTAELFPERGSEHVAPVTVTDPVRDPTALLFPADWIEFSRHRQPLGQSSPQIGGCSEFLRALSLVVSPA